MKDKLREEIAKEVYEGYTGLPWPPFDGDHAKNSAYKHADSIITIINSQRCVWTHNAEYYPNLYHTACGKVLSEDSLEQRPFCPCCGKRIEVKDGQG